MIDFKNAFLAMELLTQRSSNQIIQEAFPDLDEHMFKHMLDKFNSNGTLWGFYAAIDSDLREKFNRYLHKLAGVPYLPFNEWQFPEFPVPLSSAKGGCIKTGDSLKFWHIKNAADTLYLAIPMRKDKGFVKWTNEKQKAAIFDTTDDAQAYIKEHLPEVQGPYTITTD